MSNRFQSSSYSARGGSGQRAAYNGSPHTERESRHSPSRRRDPPPAPYPPQTPLRLPTSPIRASSCPSGATADTMRRPSADWGEGVELLAVYMQQRLDSQSVELQLSEMLLQHEDIQKSNSDYSSAPAFIQADIKRHKEKASSMSIKTKKTQEELQRIFGQLFESQMGTWKKEHLISSASKDTSKLQNVEQSLAAYERKMNELEAKVTKAQASELRISEMMDQALTRMIAMDKQIEELKGQIHFLEAQQTENERTKEITKLENAEKKRDGEILAVQAELNRENVALLQAAVKKLEGAVARSSDSERQVAQREETGHLTVLSTFQKRMARKIDNIRGELSQVKKNLDTGHQNCMPESSFDAAVNNIVQSRILTVDQWMKGIDHGMLNMETKLQHIWAIYQRPAAVSNTMSVQQSARQDYQPNKRPRNDG